MMSVRRLSPEIASLIQHVQLRSEGWESRALDNVILAALWTSNNALTSEDVRNTLVGDFGIPLLTKRVEEGLQRLRENGQAVEIESGQWKLTEAATSHCRNLSSEAGKATKAAYETFKGIIRGHCPRLPVDETWQKLNELFLLPLVRSIGAHTYEICTGLREDLEWIDVLASFLEEFTEEVRPSMRQAVSDFLDPENPPVREYVLRFLNAYFYLEALKISQDTLARLCRSKSPRFRVFLDTNFVFSMLDIHENPANEAAQALKELVANLSEHIDAQLYVLPTTIAEAKYVLISACDELMHLRLTNRLAGIALRREDLSGMAVRFIQRNQEAKHTIDATVYFAPYINNLVRCLREQGVEIYNEKVEHYKTDQRVIDDIVAVMDAQKDLPSGRRKKYEQLEHDFVLWHFVNDKRDAVVESATEAVYWAVTVDYRFIAYDHRKRTAAVWEPPICLHPATFVQMLQFWVARDESFEKALLSSVRMPFLFHEFDAEAERVTLRILGTLGRFADIDEFPETTVEALMVNEALRGRIADEPDRDAQAELVLDAVSEENRRLASELEMTRGTIEELEGDLSESQRLSGDQKETLSRKEEELQTVKVQMENLVRRIEDMEDGSKQTTRSRRYAFRWGLGGLMAVAVFALVGSWALSRYASIGYRLGATTSTLVALWPWSYFASRSARTQDLRKTPLVRTIQWLGSRVPNFVIGVAVGVFAGILVFNIVAP